MSCKRCECCKSHFLSLLLPRRWGWRSARWGPPSPGDDWPVGENRRSRAALSREHGARACSSLRSEGGGASISFWHCGGFPAAGEARRLLTAATGAKGTIPIARCRPARHLPPRWSGNGAAGWAHPSTVCGSGGDWRPVSTRGAGVPAARNSERGGRSAAMARNDRGGCRWPEMGRARAGLSAGETGGD